MKNKKIIILIVVLVWFVLLVISLIPDKQENANKGLSETQSIELLKRAQTTLFNSQGLEGNKFTDEVMLNFAFDYMVATGTYNIDYVTEEGFALVNKTDLIDVTKYVFDKDLSFDNIKYKITGNLVYIELPQYSTDAQIYKFKEEVKNSDGTYTVYIDCLEADGEMYSELSKDNVTKYDENDVMMTLIFKYKLVGERKVLLAYECDTKWW